MNQQIDKSKSPAMFDRIANKYDLVNRIVSLGIDRAWRNKLVKFVARRPGVSIIDLATGTGDIVVDLYKRATPSEVVGVDPSEEMLKIARTKCAHCPNARFEVGDAQNLRFQDGQFDFATIAFGIRNVPDPLRALKEMCRILRPNGEALVLEFSMPKSRVVRFFHLFYLRHVLPKIGGFITGDWAAYRYLNKTVEAFPYGQEFAKLMQQAGFASVEMHRMTFGVATIYRAKKV